ncbi:hypothetical protein TKK_0018022 [Trichogramma kaykai]
MSVSSWSIEANVGSFTRNRNTPSLSMTRVMASIAIVNFNSIELSTKCPKCSSATPRSRSTSRVLGARLIAAL